MPEQRLTDGSLIRDDVLLRIAVPGAENGVAFFVVRLHIAQPNDCADRDARYIDIFKRRSPRVVQHLF